MFITIKMALKMALFFPSFPNSTNYFLKKNTENFKQNYNVFFKNKIYERKLTQIYEKKLTLCGYTIKSARVKNLPNNILKKILLLALDLQALGCGPIDAKTLKQKKELYNALFFVSKNIRKVLMLGIYELHIFPDINKIDHPQKYYDCYYDCYMEYFLPANITKYLMVYYLDQNEHSTINTKNYDNTSKEQPAYLNERLTKNSNLSFMQTIEILKKQLLTCSYFIDTNKIITYWHTYYIQCNGYSINDPDYEYDGKVDEIKTDNASQQKAIRETSEKLICNVIKFTFKSYPFLKQDILIKNLICLHKKYKENEKYTPITQALERCIFLLNCMDNLFNMQYLLLIQSKDFQDYLPMKNDFVLIQSDDLKDDLPMKNELQDSLDNWLPNFITQVEKKYNFQFNKEPENYDLLCQPFCIEFDHIIKTLHSHTFQNTLFSNDTVAFNSIFAYIEKKIPYPPFSCYVLNKVENIILPKETLTPALLQKISFFSHNLKILLVKDIADDVTHEAIEKKISSFYSKIKEPFYIIINNPLSNTKPFEHKYFKIVKAISKTALNLFCRSIININDNEDTTTTKKMFIILYSCVFFIRKYKQYIPYEHIQNHLLSKNNNFFSGNFVEKDYIEFLDNIYNFLLEKLTELQLHINHFLEKNQAIKNFFESKKSNNLNLTHNALNQINTNLALSLEKEINNITLKSKTTKNILLLIYQTKNLIHIYKKYSKNIKIVYENSTSCGRFILKSKSKTFFSLLHNMNKKYKDPINLFYKKHATIINHQKAYNNNLFFPEKENNFLLDFIEYDLHLKKFKKNLAQYYTQWGIQNDLLTDNSIVYLHWKDIFERICSGIAKKIENGSYHAINLSETHYTNEQKEAIAQQFNIKMGHTVRALYDPVYYRLYYNDDLIICANNIAQKTIWECTLDDSIQLENLNN